ncbi:LAFA_0G06282g1_1 [Lachancea sp. 'fantastica']|nr:LAFA_0G06282g1_1 [Lachancea sp. 'fantastica']
MAYGSVLFILLWIPQYTCATGFLDLSFSKNKGSSFGSAMQSRSQSLYPQKRALQRDEYLQVQLTNENDFYSVTLDVGTPPQQVTVLFDTGSSDLWFSSRQNPYCASHNSDEDENYNRRANLDQTPSAISAAPDTTIMGIPVAPTIDCSQYGTFDYSHSSTFKAHRSKPFRTHYADGSFALGFWGTDELYLDDLKVSQLDFAVAEVSNSTVGVLGVGIKQLESTFNYFNSSSYIYPNFPAMLKDSGMIEKVAFSLYLNSLDATAGSVLFGGVDRSKYTGDLVTVPLVNTYKEKGVPQPIQFEITVQAVGVESRKKCLQETISSIKFPAYLDSGATLMFMDASIVEKIADSVNATWSDDWQFYMLQCPAGNDDTKLVFDFGGFHITTPLSDYILQTDQNHLCALAIIPGDQHATFGDVFLSSVYAVYDLENLELSLAEADYHPGAPDIETIRSTIPGARKAPEYSNTWEQTAANVALVTKNMFKSPLSCTSSTKATNNSTNVSTSLASSHSSKPQLPGQSGPSSISISCTDGPNNASGTSASSAGYETSTHSFIPTKTSSLSGCDSTTDSEMLSGIGSSFFSEGHRTSPAFSDGDSCTRTATNPRTRASTGAPINTLSITKAKFSFGNGNTNSASSKDTGSIYTVIASHSRSTASILTLQSSSPVSTSSTQRELGSREESIASTFWQSATHSPSARRERTERDSSSKFFKVECRTCGTLQTGNSLSESSRALKYSSRITVASSERKQTSNLMKTNRELCSSCSTTIDAALECSKSGSCPSVASATSSISTHYMITQSGSAPRGWSAKWCSYSAPIAFLLVGFLSVV